MVQPGARRPLSVTFAHGREAEYTAASRDESGVDDFETALVGRIVQKLKRLQNMPLVVSKMANEFLSPKHLTEEEADLYARLRLRHGSLVNFLKKRAELRETKDPGSPEAAFVLTKW